MAGFINFGIPQPQRVHKDCARFYPTQTRGIYEANADGSIPDLVFRWTGSDYSDQPRFNAPAPVGLVELVDREGNVVHTYGPQTPTQDATFTVSGAFLSLGAFSLRCRQAVGAVEDARYGRDQGGTQFVVVPYNTVLPHPPLGTGGYSGQIDATLNAILGFPTRVSVRLHSGAGVRYTFGGPELSGQHAANVELLATLTTYFAGYDANRTRPDGLPAHPIVLNFPDYDGSTADAALVQQIVALPMYGAVHIIMSTNEIRADNGHEGGQLSAANLLLQQRFDAARRAGAPSKLTGSPSTVAFTDQGVGLINGYLAAARQASGSSSNVYFDVLFLHDYPNANGSPGYQDYYRNVEKINWSGPILSDEVGGVSASQEGGGYGMRQARRIPLDVMWRTLARLSPEGSGYFHTQPGGGFPWQLAKGAEPHEAGAYPVVGRLYVRRLALVGTSQAPEWLTHPDPDENYILGALVHRKTTAGAQPAPSTNASVVEVRGVGDPDGVVVLAVSGSPGGTVTVWDCDGRVLSAPVVSGKVTVDRQLLGGDGIADGAYVFLPAGCNATLVDPDAGQPRISGAQIGFENTKGTDGDTPPRRILSGPWQNALKYDRGNTNTSVSIWRSAGLIHAGSPDRLTFTFAQRTHLTRAKLVFPPPWQTQTAATVFRVIGVKAGVETVLRTVDTQPAAKVIDWRTDAAGMSSWHVSFYDDRHVFPLDFGDGVDVDELVLEVLDATYGGSPTLNAATGFGRTTTDGLTYAEEAMQPQPPASPRDVETWTDGNLVGAGFAGPRRISLQRAMFRGAPAATGGSGGGGVVSPGTYYLVAAPA